MSDLKPVVFLPKPGSIHAETITERKVLLAHAQDDSELLIVWCRRNSTGGFYHAPTQTWAIYSGAGFNLSDFLDHLLQVGVRLPSDAVVTAWCLAVRDEGRQALMACVADQLKRLKVATDTGQLPRDLGEWALLQLEIHTLGRQAVRDRELRAAAQQIGGTLWARARTLEQLIAKTRTSSSFEAGPDAYRAAPIGIVRRVLHVDPACELGVRQLLRILK